MWKVLALSSAVLALTLTITHTTPLSISDLQGVGLCAKPCWIGIEPGVTTFAQVPNIVESQRPDLVVLLQQRAAAPSYALQSADLTGNIVETRRRVGYMRIDTQIPLWRLLILLDTPTCVRALGDPARRTLLEIIWETDDIALISHILMEGRNTSLLSTNLTLWQSTYSLCQTLSNTHVWAGFAVVQQQIR